VSYPMRYNDDAPLTRPPLSRVEMVKIANQHGCKDLDPFNCVLCGQIWSS
jgi:hypothetical protein